MPRRTPESDGLEVELVEVTTHDDAAVGALTAAPGPAQGRPDPATGRPPRRRRRLVLAACTVVLAAAVGVAQLVESGRSPTAGVVHGRVGSVPVAPEQLWHEPGTHWSLVSATTLVHGSGRGATVRDLRSGEVVAERDVADVGQCDPTGDVFGQDLATPTVLCVKGPTLVDGVPRMVLTSISPRDGSTLWQHALAADRWESATYVLAGGSGARSGDPRHDDLLWAVRDGALVRLVRIALADGTLRWSVEEPQEGVDGLWFDVRGDVVAFGGTLLLDLRTGLRIEDGGGPWVTTFEMPAPRGTARFTFREDGGELAVLDPEGEVRFTLPDAFPVGWWPLVSDRADVLLLGMPNGSMAVVDVRTGEELWRPSGALGHGAVAYLDDALVLLDGSYLRAVEPRTGAERWAVLADGSGWPVAAVDERRLLTGARVEGGPGLVAVDVATGDLAWELRLPSPLRKIQGADGLLVAQMESGTAVFATG